MAKETCAPINVLVFPCASGIGQEIYAALCNRRDVRLYGMNSGKKDENVGGVLYEKYIRCETLMEDGDFILTISKICKEQRIDAIFPAYDDAQLLLKSNEKTIGVKVLTSSLDTTKLCRSKLKTYAKLKGVVRVPKVFTFTEASNLLPVFAKPDCGEGSKGCRVVHTANQLEEARIDGSILCELLTGDEYTVDCFTDSSGILLFAGARKRALTRAGLSILTVTVTENEMKSLVREMAESVNVAIGFTGAWFFQFKLSSDGEPALLEVAPRIAGAMGLYRQLGINFPLLTVYAHFDRPVSLKVREVSIKMAKIYENSVCANFRFEELFVDLDDTLITSGKVNTAVLSMIYESRDLNKKIHLITRHARDVRKTLDEFAISHNLFDSIIHISDENVRKSSFLPTDRQIVFMDDSFAERQDCLDNVFACDVDATPFVRSAAKN